MLLPTSKVCLLKMKWKSPSLIFQILDIPFRDWIHYAIKEVSNLPKTWFFSLPVFDDGFNNRRPKLFLKYIHQLIKILPSSASIFFDIFLPLKKVRKKNYEKLRKLRNFFDTYYELFVCKNLPYPAYISHAKFDNLHYHISRGYLRKQTEKLF